MTDPVPHPSTHAPPGETNLLQAVRRAVRNAGWLFSSQMITRVIGFALGTVIARRFGASLFGEYMFVMTSVMYFAFLADAGLGRYLIRDAAREPARATALLSKVTSLRLVLAAAAYLLLLAVTLLTRADSERVAFTAIAGVSLLFGAVSGGFASVFNARERMRISAMFGVLSTLTTAIFVIAALVAGFGLVGVFVGTALANVPPLLYLLYTWWQSEPVPRPCIDRAVWWTALRRSFPYALLGVIGLVYFRMDSILLTWMKGTEANGIYTAAYRLLDAATDVPGVIVAAMFPTLSRLHVESKAKVRTAYLGAMAMLTVLGLPVLGVLLVGAEPIIRLLYGAEFARGAVVLQILAVAVFLIFVDTANTMVLYASDHLRPVVVLSLVTTAANIALCLILIPRYAERGAAMATVGSSALSLVIFTPVVLKSLRR